MIGIIFGIAVMSFFLLNGLGFGFASWMFLRWTIAERNPGYLVLAAVSLPLCIICLCLFAFLVSGPIEKFS